MSVWLELEHKLTGIIEKRIEMYLFVSEFHSIKIGSNSMLTFLPHFN